MPRDMEMTLAPFSTAHWMALTMASLEPPWFPKTLPINL